MTVAGRVRWVGFCVVPDERILRGWLCEPAEHGFFPRCIPSRKMLVDRLYPALSRHEIATAEAKSDIRERRLFSPSRACASRRPWTWVPLEGSPEGTSTEASLDEGQSVASETQINVVIHGYWERPRVGTGRELHPEIRGG